MHLASPTSCDRSRRPGYRLALLLAPLALSCHDSDTFHDYFHATTPREAYGAALHQAGLLEAALGREWVAVGDIALARPVAVELPYRETGYLDPASPSALGLRFSGLRGERLVVQLELADADSSQVFIDLFRAASAGRTEPRHVVSADSLSPMLEAALRSNDDYLLRVQPELLRGGRYTLTVTAEPSLRFPVEGRTSEAIQSRFGAPRDGGRRSHHGVDIFAPRGTPVLAAAAGRITRVRDGGLGGKVVWQYDETGNQYFYYAHLDSQAVVRRQEVQPGDTIGFVGNTGNARTTPPHLHFGIYLRGAGPVDPWPFLYVSGDRPPTLAADTAMLDTWLRISAPEAAVRVSPDSRSAALATLPQQSVVRAHAATGAWYRVSLPDGQPGFVAAASTEAALTGQVIELAAGIPARRVPRPDSPVVHPVGEPATADLLGRYGDYALVRMSDGLEGWVAEAR